MQRASIRQVPESFRCEEAWELTERRDVVEERIASFDGELCNFDSPASEADAVAQVGRYCDDRGVWCDLRMQLMGRLAAIWSSQERLVERLSGTVEWHPFGGHVCLRFSTIEGR